MVDTTLTVTDEKCDNLGEVSGVVLKITLR